MVGGHLGPLGTVGSHALLPGEVHIAGVGGESPWDWLVGELHPHWGVDHRVF